MIARFPSRDRQRPARRQLGLERLEQRAVLNGSPVTTLQFQIPAHVANQGVQFGFWGTDANGHPQYMKSDYTFARVDSLPANTAQLPLIPLGQGHSYTTTQTFSIPVPNVQNVSSGLVFFVGPVTNGIAVNLDSNNDPVSVAAPTPGTSRADVYGFFELNNAVGGGSSQLDVDVTTVDQFGMPFSVDFLQADNTTPITTMYPYNQGVGTLPAIDRASFFEAFQAEHGAATDPFSLCLTLGTIDSTVARLVSPRSLVTEPAFVGQTGLLDTYFDGTIKEFFEYYKANDFTYMQPQQVGAGFGTTWVGRTVTVPGSYAEDSPVDPSTTFGIQALQLRGSTGIRAIVVADGGKGYDAPPTVTIAPPDDPNGVQATATAVLKNGAVAAIVIDNPGGGYSTAPSVMLSAPTGTAPIKEQATAQPATINEFAGAVVNVYNPKSVAFNKANLPAWMASGSVQWGQVTPSAMVFAGMDAFASNAVDPGVQNPVPGTPNATYAATLPTALGNIENVIVSAFVRGIATMPSTTALSPADPTKPALLTPQQFLAGTSAAPLAWQADPAGRNLAGGTLQPNTQYFYALTTVDAAGNETVPTRVVQTTLAGHQNAAHLSWLANASPLVATFRVYRGTSAESLALVGEVANDLLAPATGFTDGDPQNAPPANAGTAPPYTFYAAGRKYDAYSKFLHERFINGLGYGNAFDDQGNFSTNVEFPAGGQPPITRIVIGDWGQAERFGATAPATAVAGTSFMIDVTAEAGDMLSFRSSDPQAVLPATQAFNPAAASLPITLKTAGVQTVTVTDATGREAIVTVTVAAAQAAKLAFAQQPGFVFAQQSFAAAVAVQVQDAYGNPVSLGGDQVSLSFLSANGATLSGTTQTNTDANGLAVFPRTGSAGLKVSKPGNYALVASFTGGTPLQIAPATSATFSVSKVAKLVVAAPSRVQANVPFRLTVTGPDQYFQGTVTFTAAGDAKVVGLDGVLRPLNRYSYTFTPGDAASRTFTVSLGKPFTTRTITASTSLPAQYNGIDSVVVKAPSTRRSRLGFAR